MKKKTKCTRKAGGEILREMIVRKRDSTLRKNRGGVGMKNRSEIDETDYISSVTKR